MHLGIITGLRSEARLLPPLRCKVTVALSGAHIEGARAALARLDAVGVTHILSWGLAGGLDPALMAGQLLLPATVLTAGGTRYGVDPKWHAEFAALLPGADCRPILALDAALIEPAVKVHAHRDTGAAAVDMESHLAAQGGRPFLVVRAVCDEARLRLPPAALAAVKPDGGTDLGAVLGSVLRTPSQVPALMRLGQAASRAQAALRTAGAVVAGVVR